jgi:hypothetical protein
MAHWYDSQPTELDRAYYERNALVAALSKVYPSHLAEHPDDPSWDPAWKFLVIINTPAGQLSWHLHLSQVGEFAHLDYEDNDWDGHTTVEKYERLAKL